MKRIYLLVLIVTSIMSCKNQQEVTQREEWITEPISGWPFIALTNTIQFQDTTYKDLANSFLIDTGYDTLAVTCKHLFLVFENNGLNSIDLGDNFKKWTIYPKGVPENNIVLGNLLNKDNKEIIGAFNTLKIRDWIVFDVSSTINEGFFPLKMRSKPIYKNDIVYSVGWAHNQSTKLPSLIKMKIYENTGGNYYYTTTITKDVDPGGRSGSPVIDSNGHLVGIISGAEGNMGVVGSISYLKETFKKYGIEYK